MQKLINHPADTVTESLQGLELAHKKLLKVCYNPHFVFRSDAPVAGKVTIISGGGSGHEPLNIGYVGYGMLDAACPGAIFTSPTPDQYLAATQAVYGGIGALYVIKNHMGGVLNMEMAMEMATEEGIVIKSVLVNDDVSIEEVDNRRGLGAAILIEKIAGAAAERGQTLDEVVDIANRVSRQARSMGVALTGCTPPSVGHPTFELPDHQAEVGVGIHGEQGRQRVPFTNADELVEILLEPILTDLKLHSGERVLALVSGLGATPQQELYIVYRSLHQQLEAKGIDVNQQLIGNYVTSLDMAGCAITLLRLDSELFDLWNAPVRTPALWW